MHKLYEFACDELKELEKKAGDKGLSAAELDYANKLTEMKKNILKIEMLEGEGYSAEYRDDMSDYARGRSMRGSYAGRRNARRDAMGRYSSERGYSRDNDELIEQLEDMMDTAPNAHARAELKKLVDKMKDD